MGLRVFYAAGPGDVVATFRHWLKGVDDPSQYAVTYSSQFFDFIERNSGDALVISSHERQDRESGGRISVINRPHAATGSVGKAGYWRGQLIEGFRLLFDLLKYRPHFAVIAEGTAPWLFVIPARLLGITIIPALHCVLWPLTKEPNRILKKLDQLAFRFAIQHCLCVSKEVIEQVKEVSGDTVDCRLFYPTYRTNQFDKYAKVDWSATPIRLLYLGRIEKDKGVFDLLEAFSRVESRIPGVFVLDLCGIGHAVQLLEEAAEEMGLRAKVNFYGHCQRAEVEARISASHIIVVPTTGAFVEGFNKVVAEGVLSRRHVIATSVCPSASIFGEAVSVVRPDDPGALADAIVAVFDSMRANSSSRETLDLGESGKLLTGEMSWETGLEKVVVD